MIVVSDTSPLVCLLHLNKLYLLKVLFQEVLIPPSVFKELETFKITDIKFLIDNPFIKIKNPKETNIVIQLLQQLDPGEAEAIVLSIEEKPDFLIIDEATGREIALLYQLPIKGTLGILLLAKEKKLVSEIKPLINQLQQQLNFRISPSLLQLVLHNANER